MTEQPNSPQQPINPNPQNPYQQSNPQAGQQPGQAPQSSQWNPVQPRPTAPSGMQPQQYGQPQAPGYLYAPQQNPYAPRPVQPVQPQGQPQGFAPQQPNFGYQQPPQYSPQGPGNFYPPQGPPPNAPAPKKIKRSPVPMIIGLVILLVVGTFSLVALLTGLSASGTTQSGGSGFFSFGDKIAILDVEGVLGAGEAYGADTERLKALVEDWTENDKIKGMVIRVNSPGGAVSATQDLFYAIEQFKATGRPVYTSMGDIAASGGYYISMASDKVYVNTGTLTGSIGVILNFYGYQELYNKIGLESRVIKSGEFKDIGSGTRPMTEAEQALLDTMIKDVFEQFFEVVMAGRSESVRELLAEKKSAETGVSVAPTSITPAEIEAHLRAYCDGRIFSGRQALEYGMADQTGTMDQALNDMRTTLGLDKDSPVILTPKPQPGLFGFFDKQVQALDRITPGSVHMEFRFEP